MCGIEDSTSVFISHASADRELVDTVVSLLRTAFPVAHLFYTGNEGYAPAGGSDIPIEHKKAIKNSKALVAIVTDSFWESPYCVAELGAAWAHDKLIMPLAFGEQEAKFNRSFFGALKWLRPDAEGITKCASDIAAAIGTELNYAKLQGDIHLAVEKIQRISPVSPASLRSIVLEIRNDFRELRGSLGPLVGIKDEIRQLRDDIQQEKLFAVMRKINQGMAAMGGVRPPHIDALRLMVDDYLQSVLTGLAEGVASLIDRTKKQLKLEDRSTIYELLLHLAGAMPKRGIWVGASHLTNTEGWLPDKGHPKFLEYAAKMRDRAKPGDLTVLRLYCAESDKQITGMKEFLRDEVRAGLNVRYMIAGKPPPDISMLFSPPESDVSPTGDPISDFEKSGAYLISAIEFQTRNDEALDSMRVFNADADRCTVLKQKFVASWRIAKRVDLDEPH